MTMQTMVVLEDELDRRVAGYEAAWTTSRSAHLASFLPSRESPNYLQTLAELIRIDMEFRSERGESPRLEAYRSQATELFADAERLGELAFEEYRQRIALGESPNASEYAANYGVDVSDWPLPTETPKAAGVFVAGVCDPGSGRPASQRPATEAGDTVGSFRILRELGRGSFGRVYLAEQTDLAGRWVALKISTRFGLSEPETLARLQHTNIVPIYATQRIGSSQIIVMPYLGSTTLADVLTALHAQQVWPASGKALADTVVDRASRTKRFDDSRTVETAPKTPQHVPLDLLRKLSYPEAVLWIGWKLAEALAHAHNRGILHRDIKPANVLLTDEGQPMLLDFNLAVDAASDRAAGVGGTPAYMAPEQLIAMKTGTTVVDARADIYSLGLVLAELMIGRSPFVGTDPLPRLRDANPTISPSTEAIIRKCLASNPAERYATAQELADELQRQLTDAPLRFTREPSIRERGRKWRRRHPLIASTGSVALLATFLILALSALVVTRQRHVQNLSADRAAIERYRVFHRAVPAVVNRLTFRDRDAVPRERVHGELDALLSQYGVLDNGEWANAAAVMRLPEIERNELIEQIGELLLLKSRLEPDFQIAIQRNEQAAAAFQKHGEIPRVVWDERHRLAAKLGRDAESRGFHERAEKVAPNYRDWYFSGLAAHDAGEFPEAIACFEKALSRDPKHDWSWLLLGHAWSVLGRDDKAEGCFNACIALQPERFMGYYNRGLCYYRRKQFAAAAADFTKVLALEPDLRKARIERGLVYAQSGRYAEAEADFTKELESGSTETRLYFLRANARSMQENVPGAAKDRAEGMRREPSDELSWVTRGLEKAAAGDATGAIEDYDRALQIHPHSYLALMNKANVYDEKLHRETDAIAALNAIVAHHPYNATPRAGRAVLSARQGDRKSALSDAEYCLTQNPSAEIRYQLAGVYALTAKTHPDDAKRAFELLRSALKDGYGYELIRIDPDLATVRDRPEFRKLIEAANMLRTSQ